jgi:UrcA family protein
MRRFIIATLGLSFALAATAAAETPDLVPTELGYSVRVHVDASDLANDQTLQALYERISDAASSICNRLVLEDSTDTLSRTSCRSDVIKRAVADANIPALTRHYAALRGGWTPAASTEVAAR